MEIDKILTEYIGEIGPYQIGVLFIVCSAAVNTAFNSIDFNFVSAVPDFWCSDVNISHLLGNFTRREIQKLVSPLKAGGSDGYDACFVYQRNYSEITGDDAREVIQHGFNQTNSGDVRQCTAWLYSREKFQSTIISQWDLVCDRYWLVALSQSVYMAGAFFVFIGGWLSDRVGRKRTAIVFMVLTIISRMAMALAPNYIMFVIARLILGIANSNWYMAMFVIAIEIVGPRWRVFAGQMPYFFWSVGYIILPGVAYLVTDWRKLTLILLSFALPYICYFCILPESIRWLRVQSKYDQATKIMRTMARINKKQVPEKVFEVTEEQITVVKKKVPWKFLLKSKTMLKNTVILSYIWFTTTLVYYGLVFYLPGLGGNIYISTCLAGVLEIPALLYVQFTLDTKLGRRLNTSFTFFVAGVALLVLMVIPKDYTWVTLCLALLGKFANAATYSIVFVHTSEIYPTVLRGVGLSVNSTAARIGGVLAPSMALMGAVSPVLPPSVFGGLSIIAGGLSLLLPETRGNILSDHMVTVRENGTILSVDQEEKSMDTTHVIST